MWMKFCIVHGYVDVHPGELTLEPKAWWFGSMFRLFPNFQNQGIVGWPLPTYTPMGNPLCKRYVYISIYIYVVGIWTQKIPWAHCWGSHPPCPGKLPDWSFKHNPSKMIFFRAIAHLKDRPLYPNSAFKFSGVLNATHYELNLQPLGPKFRSVWKDVEDSLTVTGLPFENRPKAPKGNWMFQPSTVRGELLVSAGGYAQSGFKTAPQVAWITIVLPR